MNSLDLFLVQYGVAAIFLLLLIKTIGVPIPIPADLIILTAAAQVAQGKLNLWQAFIALYTVNQMRSPINVESMHGESVPGTQHRNGSLTHGNNF